MAKKIENITDEYSIEEEPKEGSSFLDYLRFGESYTSLILGIIVVIISTALLLSFVHNRNNVNTTTTTQQTQNIAQMSEQQLKLTGAPAISPDLKPTTTAAPKPTAISKPTIAPKPTVKPTEAPKVVAKATSAPTKFVIKPTEQPKEQQADPAKGEYIIKKGDTLWSIAESQYKNGYNWVDIARANKLSNPGAINAGNKLILPKVVANVTPANDKPQVATKDEQNNSTKINTKITADSYTVAKGDTLWDIAVSSYGVGNGNRWVEIARANNLQNPSIIHSGNKLKIPRGK